MATVADPTDWAAVISAIVTGVAAITGIAATSLQARSAQRAASRDLLHSLEAQTQAVEYRSAAADNRALQAQKMRIYATFQGAVDDLIAIGDRGRQEEGEFSSAHSALLRATAEVTLIAPPAIGGLAEKIKHQLSTGIGHQGFRSGFRPVKIEPDSRVLTAKMKEDLDSYQKRPRAETRADPERSETEGTDPERRPRTRVARWTRRPRT
jgi:hypothetical protein